MWIWSRASDWWIGVDLKLIWLLELQIYTQFGVRLRRNRALRSQCTIQGQSATLTGLSLTRYLVSSILAIESRTPTYSLAAVVAFAVAYLYLHLPLWCYIQLPLKQNNIYWFGQLYTNKIIFTPKLINPTNNTKEVLKLKLQGRNYICYITLTKKLKYIKKCISPIWLQGKDLQLKKSNGLIIYYYYYLYKKLKKLQELPIILTRRSTALAHLAITIWTRTRAY